MEEHSARTEDIKFHPTPATGPVGRRVPEDARAALLEPLAPASQPCTALVLTLRSLTTSYHAAQLGGIWLGAWGLLVAAGSGGVKMCETQKAMQNEEATSEKRPWL